MMSHAAIVCREYGLPGRDRHRLGVDDDQDRAAASASTATSGTVTILD